MKGLVWDNVVEHLVPRITVLTYDCRGHGASTKMPGPYRLETFANDIEDLLNHLHWSAAHVAGASLGGNVALQFAILNPTRVQSLGLIDTTGWYGAEAAANWESRARTAEENGLAALTEFQLSRWFSDAFRANHPDTVGQCRFIFLGNDVPSYAASCRMLGAFDLRPKLAGLHVPTAIIVGEDDYATPVAMSRVLQNGIAGATLHIVPHSRHLTFIEHPGVIAQALTEIVERSSSGE